MNDNRARPQPNPALRENDLARSIATMIAITMFTIGITTAPTTSRAAGDLAHHIEVVDGDDCSPSGRSAFWKINPVAGDRKHGEHEGKNEKMDDMGILVVWRDMHRHRHTNFPTDQTTSSVSRLGRPAAPMARGPVRV